MEKFAPEAYVDALLLMSEAPFSILPMAVNEMHLFSYLGCILALFKGRPTGDWGYSYSVTSEGFPWGPELELARDAAHRSGLIDLNDKSQMSPRSSALSAELETILEIGPWAERRPWIRAATECALALPMGSIRHAVSRSPGVSAPFFLGQRGRLLEPADTKLLYDEYEVVSSVLGAEAHDLLSPAVIWLSARILRKEDELV